MSLFSRIFGSRAEWLNDKKTGRMPGQGRRVKTQEPFSVILIEAKGRVVEYSPG